MMFSKILKPVSALFIATALIVSIGASPSAALKVGGSDWADDTVCVNTHIGEDSPYILIGSWIANQYDDPCEKFAPSLGYSDFDAQELAFEYYGNCSDSDSDEIIKRVCYLGMRIQQSDLETMANESDSTIYAFIDDSDNIVLPTVGDRDSENMCITNYEFDNWIGHSFPTAQYAVGEPCLYRYTE